MAYRIQITMKHDAFENNFSFWEFTQLEPALAEFETDLLPLADSFKGKKIKVGHVSNYFIKAKEQHAFSIVPHDFDGDYNYRPTISYGVMKYFNITRLEIKDFDKLICERKSWLDKIIMHSSFIHARLIDTQYDLIQNMEDIQSYELLGIEHSHLPKINNDMPYPLNRDIVDISNNPGRWCHKQGYVEAVGAEMWLGKHFFNIVDLDKERLLNQNEIDITEKNDVVHIKAYNKPFDSADGEQADIQNKLRELLFTKTEQSK